MLWVQIIMATLCICAGLAGTGLTIIGIKESFEDGDYIFTGMFVMLTLLGLALIFLGIVVAGGLVG